MGKSTIPMAIFPIKKKDFQSMGHPGTEAGQLLVHQGQHLGANRNGDGHGASMGFQWDFNGISMGFNGFSMGFQWDFDRSFSGI
jgi:hypothetical protein